MNAIYLPWIGWNQAVKVIVALATGVLCVEEVDVAVAPLAVAVEQDHFQRVADLWAAAQEPFCGGDAAGAGNGTLTTQAGHACNLIAPPVLLAY